MMMAIIAIAKVQLRETHHGRVCFVRLLLMSMMKVTLNIMKRKLRRDCVIDDMKKKFWKIIVLKYLKAQKYFEAVDLDQEIFLQIQQSTILIQHVKFLTNANQDHQNSLESMKQRR